MKKDDQPQVILSDQQKRLVAELVETYGIDAEEVIFFAGDPKPFLTYEATCVIANQLIDLPNIDIEPLETSFVDSLSLKCIVTLPNGWTRSNVGVVNMHETIDGRLMSSQQLYQAASSRAIRNALRTAGIDLIKLHTSRGSDDTTEYTGPDRSSRANLLAQVHVLGTEAGLIGERNDRTAWKSFLFNRYGVESSAVLSEPALADLAAALKTLRPAHKMAA